MERMPTSSMGKGFERGTISCGVFFFWCRRRITDQAEEQEMGRMEGPQ